MLDESSLRRLAEMGMDVYVLRSAAAEIPATDSSDRAETSRAPARPLARVVLFARAEAPREKGMLAQVARALAFARIEAKIESAVEERQLGDAVGLVAFGAEFSRQAGRVLTSERQKTLQWITTGDIAETAPSAAAKRALWSELRRMIRGIRG
jgi:hypothetical protein